MPPSAASHRLDPWVKLPRLDGQTLGSSLLINLSTWLAAGMLGGASFALSASPLFAVAAIALLVLASPFFWIWLARRPLRPSRVVLHHPLPARRPVRQSLLTPG